MATMHKLAAPTLPAALAGHIRPRHVARQSLQHLKASSQEPSTAQDSFNVLEAFFVGRALAEVLNERLGAAAADALAEFGKLDAELRRGLQEIQDEVLSRAQREMQEASGSGSLGSGSSNGTQPGSTLPAAKTPDIGEAADELRAEVASARALVQQLKAK